jgi:hypothetical protein
VITGCRASDEGGLGSCVASDALNFHHLHLRWRLAAPADDDSAYETGVMRAARKR